MISEKIAVEDVFYKIKQFKEIISALSILSALIGPVPILLYFYYHRFLPNIEFTKFTLLFLYSFIITLTILSLIYSIFCIPGIFFKTAILTKSSSSNELSNNQIKIFIHYFITPFIIQSISLFSIILFDDKLNNVITQCFLTFIFLILPIFFGFKLGCKLDFYKKPIEFFEIIIELTITLLISNISFLITYLMFIQKITEISFINSIILFLLSLLTVIMLMLLFIKNNIINSILICVVLITTLLCFTNRFPVIADNVIKKMCIGHYQAEEVYLTPQCCQKLQSTRLLAITPHCSLQNVHVLWNFGNQCFLKLEMRGRSEYLVLDKKQDVLNFPKEAEKIIVQPS